MIPIAPICWGCRHLRDGDETCDAFPTGIPDAILGNETDHRLPVKGDHDIRFDPLSPEAADWAEHVFGPAPVAVGEYALAGVTEYAYSPNQPRKSDGKFGTGGTSGSVAPSGDGGGSGVAGSTAEGDQNHDRLDNGLRAPELYDDGRDDAVRAMKKQAMEKVGADLDAQYPAERLLAVAKTLAPHDSLFKSPGEQVADRMQESWSKSAYDASEPRTLAIQLAVANEFGTGLSKQLEFHISHANPKPGGPKTWSKNNGFDAEVLQAAVRSGYQHTQKRLDELGVGPEVTLYRGMGPNTAHSMLGPVPSKRKPTVKPVNLNPASSFTTSVSTAGDFAKSDGATLTMTVPRERIISLPGHGMGSLGEKEVIVMRGPGDRALAEPGRLFDKEQPMNGLN